MLTLYTFNQKTRQWETTQTDATNQFSVSKTIPLNMDTMFIALVEVTADVPVTLKFLFKDSILPNGENKFFSMSSIDSTNTVTETTIQINTAGTYRIPISISPNEDEMMVLASHGDINIDVNIWIKPPKYDNN